MLVPNLPVLNRAKKEGRSRTEGLSERAVAAAQKGDRTGDGGWYRPKRRFKWICLRNRYTADGQPFGADGRNSVPEKNLTRKNNSRFYPNTRFVHEYCKSISPF